MVIVLMLCSTFSCAQKEKDNPTVKEILDVSYLETDSQEDTLHRVNFYLPQDVEKPPLLIWISGGAWSIVDRYEAAGFGKKVAKQGIALASIGHSLSACVFLDPKRTTGVKHPEHIKDVAKAFSWLHKNAEKYGYDPDKIFVGGFSSGAHLSTLLASDEKYLKSHGLSFKNIKGIIPVSGGYDIAHYHQFFLDSETPHLADQHVKAVFGDTEADFKDASPTTFIDHLKVPMLMFSDGQHKYTHAELWQKLTQERSLYRAMITNFIFTH